MRGPYVHFGSELGALGAFLHVWVKNRQLGPWILLNIFINYGPELFYLELANMDSGAQIQIFVYASTILPKEYNSIPKWIKIGP